MLENGDEDPAVWTLPGDIDDMFQDWGYNADGHHVQASRIRHLYKRAIERLEEHRGNPNRHHLINNYLNRIGQFDSHHPIVSPVRAHLTRHLREIRDNPPTPQAHIIFNPNILNEAEQMQGDGLKQHRGIVIVRRNITSNRVL